AIRLDGSRAETIVPLPVKDYLVSSDLNLCLYRGTKGDLHFYRHDRGQDRLLLKTDVHFRMDHVAFGPDGKNAVFADEKENTLELFDLDTGAHRRETVAADFTEAQVAWSLDETTFFFGARTRPWLASIGSNLTLSVRAWTGTNMPGLFP